MADEAFALSPMSARAAEPSEAGLRRDPRSLHGDRARPLVPRRVRQAQPQCRHPHGARRGRANRGNALRHSDNPSSRTACPKRWSRSAAPSTRRENASRSRRSIPRRSRPASRRSRAASRIIKEISWRWREIGADGRICDLIDSQLASIEAGCGQISNIDPRAALQRRIRSDQGRASTDSLTTERRGSGAASRRRRARDGSPTSMPSARCSPAKLTMAPTSRLPSRS